MTGGYGCSDAHGIGARDNDPLMVVLPLPYERFAINLGAILVSLAAGMCSLYFVGQKMLRARYGTCDLLTYGIWSRTFILLPPCTRCGDGFTIGQT